MGIIDQNLEKIHQLCKQHYVSQLFVFGSVLTDRFDNNSDVDFLVDFSDIDLRDYADNYFSLKQALEEIFKRQVDLLENNAIRNPYLRQSINSSKRLLYESLNQNLAL
jgi:predicted nucleotidyltransferase